MMDHYHSLRIRCSNATDEMIYHCYLDERGCGRHRVDAATRQELLKELYRINMSLENALLSEQDTKEEAVRLQALGQSMYKVLLPESLRLKLERLDPSFILLDTTDNAIPWELLHDGCSFLGLKHALGRAAGRRQTPALDRGKGVNVCIVGNPSGDLESAAEEAAEIQKLLATELLELKQRHNIQTSIRFFSENDATKKHVLLDILLSGREPLDIFHFSGHVTVNDRAPSHSSLTLCDGELRAFELDNMAVSPVMFVNGCYSGMSLPMELPIETITEGLAEYALGAGAIGFIGTLIPVSDEIARSVALSFYSSILEGYSIGQALLEAKRQVHSIHPHDPTAVSYILFGDPHVKLPIFEPQLTDGPFINKDGVRAVYELEKKYHRLELLLVNDLPWILWRDSDFENWIDEMKIRGETSRTELYLLFKDYKRFFTDLILSGKKTFKGIVNLRTLRRYLSGLSGESLDSLKIELLELSKATSFTLLFFEAEDEEIEEIELVSKNEDLFADLNESLYVFNKQVRFESPVTYSLFADLHNPIIAEYGKRFFDYWNRAIEQYRVRFGNVDETIDGGLNQRSFEILQSEIERL